jgi:hypothetical protein
VKTKIIAAVLLSLSAFGASAADQAFNIVPDVTYDFNGMALPGNGLLSGGSDTIVFTGVPGGMYEAILSYSANYALISSASLNGMAPVSISAGVKTSLGSFDIIGNSPFTLVLNGIASSSPLAAYSGHITISAVPEPTSFAMLLLGLGLFGVGIARKSSSSSDAKFY